MNNPQSHNIDTNGKNNSLALDKCNKAGLDKSREKET